MDEEKSGSNFPKALIIGLVAVIIVLGAALIILAIGQSGSTVHAEEVNVLEDSSDECVVCHKRTTPGIVEQYGHSSMAAAEVSCSDCHEVKKGYPGSEEHEGTYVLQSPTTAMCQKCHAAETAQYNQSRHGLPAYVAYAGSKELSPELMAVYESIPEGGYSPDKERNALYELEGPAITPFACEDCHNIGKPAEDNSIGQCQKCHIRHEFSQER